MYYYRGIKLSNSEVTEYCDTSSWTEFYSLDLGEKMWIDSILIKSQNGHKIKITIDNITVIAESMTDIKELYYDDCSVDDENFKVSFVNNILAFWMNMEKTFGQVIKIYQQRNSGTGNLTLFGISVSVRREI